MSKKNILMIACAIFIMTMSTILFLVGEEDLKVENDEIKTSVLNTTDSQKILSEEEYRKLLNNYEDEFIIVNTDRTFRFLSPNLLKIHGYSPEEITKLNVLTFIHPKDLPSFSNMLMEFHKELKVMNNLGPIRVKTRTGEFINYLITLIPFADKEGERTGTGVILKNIDKPLGDTEEKA